MKQAYYSKLNNQSSGCKAGESPSRQPTAALTLGEVSEALRKRLETLGNHYQEYKGRGESFFTSPRMVQLLHAVDSLTKITVNNSGNR